MFYHFIVGLAWIVFHLWFNLKIEGRENIPKGKNFVYASNHRSYADPVLIAITGKGKIRIYGESRII